MELPDLFCEYLSRLMGKPTICICENKGADQLRSYCAFVFATRIVQFLFYFNPKFQASSSFLCLYRSVCVVPARKPHCWFSHEAAHILLQLRKTYSLKELERRRHRIIESCLGHIRRTAVTRCRTIVHAPAQFPTIGCVPIIVARAPRKVRGK